MSFLVLCLLCAGGGQAWAGDRKTVRELWKAADRRAAKIDELLARQNLPAATIEALAALALMERLEAELEAQPEQKDFREQEEPEWQARFHVHQAVCHLVMERLPEALEHAKAALALRRELHPDDHIDVARSLALVAYVQFGMTQSVTALEQAEGALEMRRRLFAGDHWEEAASLAYVGFMLERSGRVRLGLEHLQQAVAMHERLDRPSEAAALHAWIAEYYMSLDQPKLAEKAALRCVAELQALAEQKLVPAATFPLAQALVILNRYEEALSIYETLAQQCLEAGNPAWAALIADDPCRCKSSRFRLFSVGSLCVGGTASR